MTLAKTFSKSAALSSTCKFNKEATISWMTNFSTHISMLSTTTERTQSSFLLINFPQSRVLLTERPTASQIDKSNWFIRNSTIWPKTEKELFSTIKKNIWKKIRCSQIKINSQNLSQDFQLDKLENHIPLNKRSWLKEFQDRNHTLLPNQRKCWQENTLNQSWLLPKSQLEELLLSQDH